MTPRFTLSDGLHSLIGVMTSFVVSCVRAENQLSNDRVGGFGRQFLEHSQHLRSLLKKMVCHLGIVRTPIMNKTGKPSEVVIFIDELQKCIPREYRRGKTHGTSLTEMISRACRSQVRERWITPT